LAKARKRFSELEASHDSLERERTVLRTLIDNLQDYVYAKDLQGRFVAANLAVARQLGFSAPEELVGKSDFDLFPHELAAQYHADEQAMLQTGKEMHDHEGPTVDAAKDPQDRWVSTTKTLLRNTHGKIVGFVGIDRDITERRQAEEALRLSEEKHRGIFMNAPFGIFRTTMDGKLVSANPAIAHMLGYDTPEELIETVNRESVAEVLLEDLEGRLLFVDDESRKGQWRSVEGRFRRKRGEPVTVSLMIRSYLQPGGARVELEGIVEDITERKRLETKLEEERALLRTVIDIIPDNIYVKDRESRFLHGNTALARVLGTNAPEDVLGKTDSDYFPAEMAEKFREDELRVMKTGHGLINIEENTAQHAGSERWLLTTKVPLIDRAGAITGIVGIGRDITERKRAEEMLRLSEEGYRTIFTSAPFGILHTTTAGKILRANPAIAIMLGYGSAEELVETVNRKSIAEILYEDQGRHAAQVDEALPDGQWRRFEERYRRKDGGTVTAQLRVRSYDQPGGTGVELESFIEDVTDRKRAEAALSRERAFLNVFMDTIPDYIYFKDGQSRFMMANKALVKLCNVSDPAEMVGKSDFDFFSREYAQSTYDDEQRIIRTGQPMIDNVEKAIRPGRPVTWASVTKLPLRDDKGDIVGTFGISRDITERRQTEEKNIRLATLVESSADAIVGLDLNRVVTSWNKGAENVYGYRAEEAIGRPSSLFMPPELDDEARELRAKILRGEHIESFETQRRRKDGALIHVSLALSPIRNKEGEVVGIASIARDITGQKALQAQIMRAQRLESLGTLAGGIAHQFNNINTAVKGYLDLLLQSEDLSSKPRSYAQEALKGVQRAVDITDRLQGLSGTAQAGEGAFRLDDLVRSLLPLFEKRIEAQSVTVILDLLETPALRINRAQIDFILASLLTNSLDALLDRPLQLITVRSGRVPGFALVEVGDTGCGIPSENLSRLFTPFFTTKGEWAPTRSAQSQLRGVGLSLAVSQSTVSEYGGRIEVESEAGTGSTFRLLLPSP
jgi:PAS domain S-box-containing protein